MESLFVSNSLCRLGSPVVKDARASILHSTTSPNDDRFVSRWLTAWVNEWVTHLAASSHTFSRMRKASCAFSIAVTYRFSFSYLLALPCPPPVSVGLSLSLSTLVAPFRLRGDRPLWRRLSRGPNANLRHTARRTKLRLRSYRGNNKEDRRRTRKRFESNKGECSFGMFGSCALPYIEGDVITPELLATRCGLNHWPDMGLDRARLVIKHFHDL